MVSVVNMGFIVLNTCPLLNHVHVLLSVTLFVSSEVTGFAAV